VEIKAYVEDLDEGEPILTGYILSFSINFTLNQDEKAAYRGLLVDEQ